MPSDAKNLKLAAWLAPLSPPAGGEARLRAALDQRRMSAWVYWSPTIAALALCALAVTVLRTPADAALRAGLSQAWAQGEGADLAVSSGAAAPLLRTPALRIYWVVVPEKNSTSSTRPSATR